MYVFKVQIWKPQSGLSKWESGLGFQYLYLSELTVKAPPTSCPSNISGLVNAVHNRKPPNIIPINVHSEMYLGFDIGTKKAKKAIIGLAIACKVTLKWYTAFPYGRHE